MGTRKKRDNIPLFTKKRQIPAPMKAGKYFFPTFSENNGNQSATKGRRAIILALFIAKARER